ncbi:3502_t:CDS:2 [Diversispora eburnea]|uniref:3502_t:CDS:1 n=1 Tax=Diversispora eburnea TaxID=1213867 RepID=A0A9N9CAC3_9GLOM|nr:3502_t:CDS:2 [Diversispora eburnea]
MSLSINTTKIVKVPFPPSVSVDEIIQIHLKNGIKTSKSWKSEPEYVKNYYKQISKEVKKLFKKIVPCFINKFGTSNQVGTNDVSLEISPPIDQNSPETIYSSHQFVNIRPINQISPDNACYNSLFMNIEQNSLGTTCYNPPLSNSPDAIYSSHRSVNMNKGQNSLDATNSNLPVDQFPLGITFPDPSNMEQITTGITSYNSPFTTVLGITHVNSPPSNYLKTIYSSQNSPDATNSNLPVDQFPLGITFPDPSNMDQISTGITCYNSPFTNVLGITHVNSPPSNSFNTIYSDQNSPDADPLMVQNPLKITFLDPSMNQISPGNDCYNSLLMNSDKNTTYSDYPLLNIDQTLNQL